MELSKGSCEKNTPAMYRGDSGKHENAKDGCHRGGTYEKASEVWENSTIYEKV
jgi:hypothetical protein